MQSVTKMTRRFANHEFRLLSRSHTLAIIVILVQLPWYGNTCIKVCGYSDFFQKLNQKINDPKMIFDPTSVEVTCAGASILLLFASNAGK